MEATVAKIKKNAEAEIWVLLREFQGRQYFDVREHFLSHDDRKWHPTRKGLMLLPEVIGQVIDGLATLEGIQTLGTVSTIPKSDRYQIQIGYREFAQSRYGDLRLWYRAGEDDEVKPSPKGVTFKVDLASKLVTALHAAKEQLAKGQPEALRA